MTDFSWTQWDAQKIDAAVEAACTTKRNAYQALYAVPPAERTFANTIVAMDRSSDQISDVQQAVQVLMNVHPDQALRDACQVANDRIEAANIEMDFDIRLWNAVSEWQATNETLTAPEDIKLAHDILRDLRRMGFALPPDQFQRFKENRKELQKMEGEFEKSINEYEDFIAVTKEELDGMSERYISGLQKLPDGRYRISLEYPDLYPYLQYATNAVRREELAHKMYRRGGPENMERLAAMVRLRQEGARLLGYATHADFVTEPRMTRSKKVVDDFLGDILNKTAATSKQELRDLIDIKKRELKLEHPAPMHYHETAFWSEKLRRERYDLDNELVKEYFPLAKVLEGMLAMYQEILGVRFTLVSDALTWHPDVKAYSVTDAKSGSPIGSFMLDLYPRKGKYGHAAAFPTILARQTDAETVTGLVCLVCNFPKPTDDNPSLLTHDEVETFLHEFGHVMHGLLSGGKYQRQNGFGVPMDFVEALSQIFEYWAWDAQVLARLTGHYKTGETLPQAVLDKMLAARRHMEARFYATQSMRSLYDLSIHGQPTDATVSALKLGQLYRDLTLQLLDIDLPDDAIYPAGWTHLGDYDAAYYGYLWSKVYAADMFTRFAANPLDTTIGSDYRAKVLGPGSSKPERELVQDFLGRSANNEAFLAELGIS